jgi:hypothetical protein
MPSRSRKKLVAEPRWPSAYGVHSAPYSLGHEAGAAVVALLAQRQDHVTCSVEWYRGFCQGCGSTPEPKVEAYIAREALAAKHGLDRVAIILAGLEAMTEDVQQVLGKDSPGKARKP